MARNVGGISGLTSTNRPGQTKSLMEILLDHYGSFNFGTVVSPTPLINLNASLPLSEIRDLQYTSGSGTITQVGSEYRLRVTGPNDVAELESSARGRYIPGLEASAGVAVRLDIANDTISGDMTVEWGYFDDSVTEGVVNNGLLFGADSGGTYVRIVRAGTEIHKTYSESWNIARNPINDTETPFNALTHSGIICDIQFVYYGYGLVKFILNDANTGDFSQRNTTVHTVKTDGAPLIENSNLKVGAIIKAGTGSDTGDVYIGGRKYQVLGRFDPAQRVTSHTVIDFATSTTLLPVMSFRRKTGFEPVTIFPQGLAALGATEDHILSIRINSTLTGANYGAVPGTQASETVSELDTSASAIDSGTGVKIFEGLIPAGQAQQANAFATTELITDVPDGGVVSFCVRTTSGTGTVTMTGRMREEF